MTDIPAGMKPEDIFGWIPEEARNRETQQAYEEEFALMQPLTTVGANLTGSGKGKVILLHKYLTELRGGRFPVNLQTIGDCVSHGYGKAIENLMAVEILRKGENESFPALCATEWLYGTGRVLVGKGRIGNQDGSLGTWQQKAVREHGTLLRKKYGQHDLTTYSGKRAKDWGYKGLPLDLETIADEHPVKSTAIVTSYEEARDAIANGYPVAVCSSQGFEMKRDGEGFARPKGKWPHCMYFCAVDDEYKRPGLLCVNSWGENWIDGPKRHDQPNGSFWVDANICTKMLRGQDSFALSNFEGYPSQEIDPRLF